MCGACQEEMIDSIDKLQAEMRACRRCLTAGHAIVPGAVFRGVATARVMLIGQAPGTTEVQVKRPFNAGSGRRLFHWLGRAGWDEDDFRDQQYMTAVTKCYPGKPRSGKGDRVPSKAEQAICRPFLDREMALIKPWLIIPVGGLAIKHFYPKKATLRQIVGTAVWLPPATIPPSGVTYSLEQAQKVTDIGDHPPGFGRYIIPLPHPSGASLWPNKPENKLLIERAITLLFDLRLKWAL